MARTKILASEVLELLASGVTRTTKDKNYNEELGSIEEKYNLSKAEVAALFSHPVLKGARTRTVAPFELIDDVTPSISENINETAEENAIEFTPAPAAQQDTNINEAELSEAETAELSDLLS